MNLADFRRELAEHLGRELTPERCVALERAFFGQGDASHDPAKFGVQQCGSLTFQVERFALVLPELHALHQAHWAETEAFRHHLPMNPDYDAMAADERAGRMLQFTARRRGELVGQMRVYLRLGRHTQTLHAIEDTLFIRPDARGGRVAYRFVQFGEQCLRQIGVMEIRCTAKLANNTARFFQGCGYKPVATELVKFLE